MRGSQYVTIEAHYERRYRGGRSLSKIAPELGGIGLAMTEDHTDDLADPSCTWAGTVDGSTFGRFADAWRLDERPDSPGDDHILDGMNWEVEGWSPVVYVALRVRPV
jgi:hypothetical protein